MPEFGGRIKFICLIPLALSIWAQEQPNPRDLLLDIRLKVMAMLNRLPRYMCTLTIDRLRNEGDTSDTPCGSLLSLQNAGEIKRRPIESDRLRFDVGLAGDKEIYSWAGENQFESKNLLDMVHSGAISTGSFATLLRMVFDGDTSRFVLHPAQSYSHDKPWRAQSAFFYLGEKTVGERKAVEFAFRVPVGQSHYLFRNSQKQSLTTAYDGGFLVDSKTLDLIRLTIQTSELPPETGACEVATITEYRRVPLNAADFLIPSESRMRIFNANGSENDNRIVYSGCHEFLAASTVRFDPPPDEISSSQRSTAAKPFEIPAGLHFETALTEGIDTSTAAAGDRVAAKLSGPIRFGREVLAKEGAPVVYRISGIERHYGANPFWRVTLRPETITVGASAVPLNAMFEHPEFVRSMGGFRPRNAPLGTLRDQDDGKTAALIFDPKARVPGRGAKIRWVTLPPTR